MGHWLSLQCLLEENEILKREIQRLKRDNAELILIAKTAAADRDMVLVSTYRWTVTEVTAFKVDSKLEPKLAWKHRKFANISDGFGLFYL